MTLNDAGTIVGIVAGTAGLVLGILNHLRDKYKITVELSWDMKPYNLPDYDPEIPVGVIRVTNIGRRTAYVSHIALKIPKDYEGTHLVIMEGLEGHKLEEGSQPFTLPVPQEGLEKYAEDWKKLRAQVSDSTGKVWYSKRRWRGEPPSWAK